MIASEYDELDRELGDLADERAARKRAGGVRMLPIMVGVVSLFALGGIVWYAYTQGVREGSEVAAPLLRPDSPAKETPDDPGGRQISGAELGVYDMVNGADGASRPNVERILPEPEEPQTLPTTPPQPVPETRSTAADQPAAPAGTDGLANAGSVPQQREPVPQPNAEQTAPLPDDSLAAPAAPPPTAGADTQGVAATADAPAEPPPAPPAPEPEPEQSAAAPAGSAGDGWRIQVAALKSDAAARSQWSKVQAANQDLLGTLSLQVQKATVNGTDYFRVRGGPLDSGDAAKALCAKLKAKGVACIPVAPGK